MKAEHIFLSLAILLVSCGQASQADKKSATSNQQADSTEVVLQNNKEVGDEERPARNEYSFKTTIHIDDSDDLVDSITIVGWARGKQTDFIFGHELWIKQFKEKKEWFKEEDINFDGFPDLMVYHGYIGFGGQGGDVFVAFVWKPDERKFIQVEDFDAIPDPMFDAEAKTISTTYRADYEYVDSYTFKWDGDKLKEVDWNHEPIRMDGGEEDD